MKCPLAWSILWSHHDADMAFPEDEIAATQAVEIDRPGLSQAFLHVGIARAINAGGTEGRLDEARTIEAEDRLATPAIGNAQELLRDRDEIRRGIAKQRGWPAIA